MTKLNEWVENELNPWKEAMAEHQRNMINPGTIVQKNAAELKYIVALLLEKREKEAVKIWNDLGLKPTLAEIKLNLPKDELVLTHKDGKAQHLSVVAMLEELQVMLDG